MSGFSVKVRFLVAPDVEGWESSSLPPDSQPPCPIPESETLGTALETKQQVICPSSVLPRASLGLLTVPRPQGLYSRRDSRDESSQYRTQLEASLDSLQYKLFCKSRVFGHRSILSSRNSTPITTDYTRSQWS